jgi:hypothetical protein
MEILLKRKPYLKLKYYIDLCPNEISGLGKSYIKKLSTGEKQIIVTDVIIFEQENTAGTTSLDTQMLAKVTAELMKQNENIEQWDIWWHSHAHMKAFFSKQDNDTIEDHSATREYLISIVGNKEGQFVARLDIFLKNTTKFNLDLSYSEDLKVLIETISNNKIAEQCQKDIKLKVKEPVKQIGFNTEYYGKNKFKGKTFGKDFEHTTKVKDWSKNNYGWDNLDSFDY